MKSESRNFLSGVGVLVLLVMIGAGSVWAQAPNSISYSGLLTNAQGEPREGSFPLTFRIYDNPVGGLPLHVQAIPTVVVRKGQFNVLLGPFADNVFLQGSGSRYVEVQLGNDPPLLPRQQLTSVPFAQRVASIEGVRGGSVTGGLNVAGNVGIGTTSPRDRLTVFGGNILYYTNSGVAGSTGGLSFVTSSAPLAKITAFVHVERPIPDSHGGNLLFGTSPREGIDPTERMRIDRNGNVGIGTTSPGSKLHVAGRVLANGYDVTSDIRLKEDVAPLTGVLEKLDKIRGVSFKWNAQATSLGYSSSRRDFGVIAQEVAAVFPELVTAAASETYWAVDYSKLTAILLEAVKELKAENRALRYRMEVLENR